VFKEGDLTEKVQKIIDEFVQDYLNVIEKQYSSFYHSASSKNNEVIGDKRESSNF